MSLNQLISNVSKPWLNARMNNLIIDGQITIQDAPVDPPNVVPNLLVLGNADVLGNLVTDTFTANTSTMDNLTVNLATELNTLEVSGISIFSGDITSGNITSDNITTDNLTVNFATQLNTLITSGLSTFNGDVDFNGTINIGTVELDDLELLTLVVSNTLISNATNTFTNNTTFGGPVGFNGLSNFSVLSSFASINVSQASLFQNDLEIQGILRAESGFVSTSTATINQMTVNGLSTFNNNVSYNESINLLKNGISSPLEDYYEVDYNDVTLEGTAIGAPAVINGVSGVKVGTSFTLHIPELEITGGSLINGNLFYRIDNFDNRAKPLNTGITFTSIINPADGTSFNGNKLIINTSFAGEILIDIFQNYNNITIQAGPNTLVMPPLSLSWVCVE